MSWPHLPWLTQTFCQGPGYIHGPCTTSKEGIKKSAGTGSAALPPPLSILAYSQDGFICQSCQPLLCPDASSRILLCLRARVVPKELLFGMPFRVTIATPVRDCTSVAWQMWGDWLCAVEYRLGMHQSCLIITYLWCFYSCIWVFILPLHIFGDNGIDSRSRTPSCLQFYSWIKCAWCFWLLALSFNIQKFIWGGTNTSKTFCLCQVLSGISTLY